MKPTLLMKSFNVFMLLSMIIMLTAIQPADVKAAVVNDEETSLLLANANELGYVPNRLILKTKAGITFNTESKAGVQSGINTLDALMKMQGITSITKLYTEIGLSLQQKSSQAEEVFILQLDGQTGVEQAAQALLMDPNVDWVEPDYVAKAITTTPNDTDYSSQWGLTKIQAETAWDTTTGSSSVVIAVIDSGIDLTHPDLDGKLWVNPGEIAGNGIDDDSNGLIDDVHGWNFIGLNNNLMDSSGHGTQVAGVAAAETNNANGVAGVCWGCTIMPVRVMSGEGNANYSDVALGVRYAAEKDADVINLSLGGYAYSNALKEAIDYAVSKGVVVIGGAGNDDLSTLFYPAAYENVLAVASTDQNDLKADFSNYGDWVDVSAPGIDIRTTFLGGDTGTNSGTSLSAPFVSGLVGLIMSQHTDWSEVMVRNHIIQTSVSIDAANPTYSGKLGKGRINAAQAMTNPQPLLAINSIKVDGVLNGRPTPGTTVTLDLGLSNQWADANNASAVLSTSDSFVTINTNNAGYGSIPSGATVTNSTPFQFAVNSSAGYNHVINFNLRLTANGGAYTANLPFTVTTRSANEEISSTIAADMTWTKDKIYLIMRDVGVLNGATLTIQPGTEVRFMGDYSFSIGGTLKAIGTAAEPIRFSGNEGLSWQKIRFLDSSIDSAVDADLNYVSGSVLSHVVIDGAATGITCETASPYLDHIQLSGGGINCATGDLTFEDEVKTGTIVLKDSQVKGNVNFNQKVFLIGNSFEGNYIGVGGFDYLVSLEYTEPPSPEAVAAACLVEGNQFKKSRISSSNACAFLDNEVSFGSIQSGNFSVIKNNNIESSKSSLNEVMPGENPGMVLGVSVLIENNRVIDCDSGIRFTSGIVKNNLIANNDLYGLVIQTNYYWDNTIFTVLVQNNTFTGNQNSSFLINKMNAMYPDEPKSTFSYSVVINQNNFEGNFGEYDIENHMETAYLASVDATQNWWGTTNSTYIQNRIYDQHVDIEVGPVNITPVLTSPVVDAPAYVRSVSLNPESPVGIQTVTFDVLFSKPMNRDIMPKMGFTSTQKDTWESFVVSEEDNLFINDIVEHPNGELWAATSLGPYVFNGTNWEYVDFPAYEIPGIGKDSFLSQVVVHPNGSIWFSNNMSSTMSLIYCYDGVKWQVFTISYPWTGILFIQPNGNVWLTSGQGLFKLDGNEFLLINTENSTIPTNIINYGIAHPDGSIWFTTISGIIKYDGVNYKVYNFESFPESLVLDSNNVLWTLSDRSLYWFNGSDWQIKFKINDSTLYFYQAFAGVNGDLWFSSSQGPYHFDNQGNLTRLTVENSQLLSNQIKQINVQANGSVWFLYNEWEYENQVSVLYDRPIYPVQNSTTLEGETHWKASFDFTSAIERDDYRFDISGAVGSDGMEIAPFNHRTFTVDYAGYIDDDTPPAKPMVEACSYTQVDKLSASWSVNDPESAVDLYHYAIGTTPGGTEVVNWTTTESTSFVRTGLSLISGKEYYISVQARNQGGLWSKAGTPDAVIAGMDLCTSNISSVFLPLLTR